MKRLTITKLRLLVPLAALGALILAGLSYGQATVGTFYNQETFTAIEPEFVCGPATTGVITNTVTESGISPSPTRECTSAELPSRTIESTSRTAATSSPPRPAISSSPPRRVA